MLISSTCIEGTRLLLFHVPVLHKLRFSAIHQFSNLQHKQTVVLSQCLSCSDYVTREEQKESYSVSHVETNERSWQVTLNPPSADFITNSSLTPKLNQHLAHWYWTKPQVHFILKPCSWLTWFSVFLMHQTALQSGTASSERKCFHHNPDVIFNNKTRLKQNKRF